MNLEKIIAIRNAKTIYCDENNCVKVFNKEYSKADILNEALNQARVEELPINVPKIKEVTMIDGKWAIITEYIKGYTLLQLMEKYPEKKDQYLEQFVDIQLATQKNTCPLLTKLKDKMNRKINMADIASTTKYDLHTRLESMPKGNSLCHGDFNPSNIIISEDNKPYIIDWSHATKVIHVLMPQELTYYSGYQVTLQVRKSILIYMLKKEMLLKKTFKNGCQSLLLLNQLRVTKKKESSYFLGLML